MAQKTIAQIQEMSLSRPTPYSGSLIAKVVQVGHSAKFQTSNGEDAEILNFSLADNTGAMLATCTDKTKERLIKEGKTLLLRDFIIKNGKLALSHKTKAMMKPNITIPDDLLEKAKHLILPPSPTKKIEDILAAPLRSITTVQGQLSKIESTRTVKVSGTNTTIRTVSLEEDGRKIDVTLWRDHAEKDLQIGQYLAVSHCMLNEWQGQKALNTTRNTTIQIIQPLMTTMKGSIEALVLGDVSVEIALKESEGQEYRDFEMDLTLVTSLFPDMKDATTDQVEEYLLQKLPISVELTLEGSDVRSVKLLEEVEELVSTRSN